MMVRVYCEACAVSFVMPQGASIGEMSAWMRWHADETGHVLDVDAKRPEGSARTLRITELRDALAKSREYDEGVRDAAQFITGCIDTAMMPVTDARTRGADAFLARVRWYVAQQLARTSTLSIAREVSPDAETVREQADALDVGKPSDAGEDDTAPLDVEGGNDDGA